MKELSGPVIFLGGLLVGRALGIAGTIFSFRKKENEENRKIVDENNELREKIEKLEAALGGAIKNIESVNNELSAANDALKENRDSYSIEEYQKLYSGEDESHEVRDYTKFHSTGVDPAEMESPSERDGDEYMDEDEEALREREEDVATGNLVTEENENYIRGEEMTESLSYVPGRKPKIISAESFENEMRHFDKQQLYYYVGDETLATEEEEIIRNVDQVVGDALDKYGFRENDESIIYVRNLDFSTDYEIEKVYSRFGDLY